MNKPAIRKNEQEPEPLDESWWSAILSEAENGKKIPVNYYPPKKQEPPKNQVSQTTDHNPAINWLLIQEAYAHDEVLCLQVIGYNRGGLLVEGDGVQGFVPLSHLVQSTLDRERSTSRPSEEFLAVYMGKPISLKIIECDPEHGRIVFSERAALAEPGRRNQLLQELQPGDTVTGKVTNVTDFGVFLDLGGLEGLVHVSELSWGRVRHPSDVATVGKVLKAYVIQVDKERSRVALSLKRLHPNPWASVSQRYFPGQVIDVMITSVVSFGAFARLEEGLDGLIHISQINNDDRNAAAKPQLVEGQWVKVRILQVDANRQRLGLSLISTHVER